MQNNKISSYPPKKSMQDFITEADSKKRVYEHKEYPEKKNYPWNADHIREDIKKAFTAQLPEEYILKIKYISDITGKPQQKLIREVITSNIDSILKELGVSL